MNIDTAKKIPLFDILQIMGHSPVKPSERELWYLSPLRTEKTPSFHVTIDKNKWYDFGSGKGGDSIALVCEHLKQQGEDHTPSDALRWLRNMSGYMPILHISKAVKEEKPSVWHVKKVKGIESIALINYLKTRGIELSLAKKHLKEVYVRHTEKPMGVFALGFKNEDGGYELRNSFLQSSVFPKNITFTRAEQPSPEGINFFEGWPDFLAAATRFPEMVIKNDNITLNSVAMVERAFPYLKGFGYKLLYDWMDNDKAGKEASGKIKLFAKEEPGLQYKPMQKLFTPYKDVNEWHVKTYKFIL